MKRPERKISQGPIVLVLDGLSKKEQQKAETAALSTAKYLWNFLSGMSAKHNLLEAA